MANTFFGFNTTLNEHGDRLGSSPEDIEGLEAEEEYDALNDETFGALENTEELDDWEAQHEQLAEIAESSRHSNDIESFLGQLGLNDDETSVIPKDSSVWAYTEVKNGDRLNNSSGLDSSKLLSGLNSSDDKNFVTNSLFSHVGTPPHSRAPGSAATTPKLRTVEELERMLLNQSKPGQQLKDAGRVPPPGLQPLFPGSSPWPPPGAGVGPPGGPPGPPGSQVGPPGGPPGLPPGLVRVLGARPPPGFVQFPQQQQQQGFPLPPHFNFPPPPRLPNLPPGLLPPRGGAPHHKHPQHGYPHNMPGPPHGVPPHHGAPLHHGGPLPPPHHRPHPHAMPPYHHHGPPHQQHNNNNQQQMNHYGYQNQNQNQSQSQSQSQYHQQQQYHNNNNGGPGGDCKDEYAGLMNNREKQWLLNIQLLQVNTGTPYFDDYYYTVFKERQAKNKENLSESRLNQQRYHNRGNQRDGNVGHHQQQQRGAQNHVQEAQNPVKKTYTPLQFENSLGKLQFGSVTAPRKIIDMDIIASSDSETQVTSRDSRKTKQLLLELEALYSLLLRAEDLRNPVAVANQEKLLELKQKQRLREMDAAPTPEQKQEVLKLLQAESQPHRESPQELLSRVLSSLLDSTSASDRLTSFLGVRKGKMLVLRALPLFELYSDIFQEQIRELWMKMLAAVAVIGRRDSSGDNVLVKMYPMFKRYINSTDMEQILELISTLTEIIKVENNRSTPLSHQSRAPLHFILQNKFGISAISTILQRVDSLLVTSSEKQQSDWSSFLTCLSDALLLATSVQSLPLEPISDECLNRVAGNLNNEKKLILEKVFVENL